MATLCRQFDLTFKIVNDLIASPLHISWETLRCNDMNLSILLFLSTMLLFPMTPRQDKGKIWSTRSHKSYKYSADGIARSRTEETTAWNLPPRFDLLLDEEFAKRLKTERLDELQKLARDAKSEAAEISKKISREPNKTEELVSEWEAYLKDAEKRFHATIEPAALRVIEASETADSFFKLGFKDFMKQRLPEGSEVPKLDDVTSKSIRSNLRKIESQVLEILLRDLAFEKQVELKEVFASTIPDRNPSLSILWQSLSSLESNQRKSVSLPMEESIFIVQSGRLVKVSSRPVDEVLDLVESLANIARRQESQAIRGELAETIRDVYQVRNERESNVFKKIEDLGDAYFDDRKIRTERKKLAEEYYSELREFASNFIQQAEPRLKGQLRAVKLVVNYQRFGIEKAILSDSSRELLEFPLDDADRKRISARATEARNLLEEQVRLMLRRLFRERMGSQLPLDDISVRWLDARYPYQIPPVELLSEWFEE